MALGGSLGKCRDKMRGLILCSLPPQGFFIFLFHCLLNSEVRLFYFLKTRSGVFISERAQGAGTVLPIGLVSGSVNLNRLWSCVQWGCFLSALLLHPGR